MPDISPETIQREAAALEEQRRGGVMMTAGKVLLWMDLVLVCFVYAGLRAGSHLFLWWVIGEAVLGLALLGAGSHKRSEASRILAEVSTIPSQRNLNNQAEQQHEQAERFTGH